METPPQRTLEGLCRELLAQDPSRQVLEHEGRWLTWGDLRGLADKVTALLDRSAGHAAGNVALMARCRPSAVGTLLGLFASGRTVQMIHVYQKSAGVVRDMDKLKPAALIAAREDLTDELLAALAERSIAAIALDELDAAPLGTATGAEAAADPATEPRHLYVLSSGTTGVPKHIPMSYDIIARHLVGQNSVLARGAAVDETPPKYLYAPLGNISGVMSFASITLTGERALISEKFKVEDWVAYVRRFRPAFMGLPAAGIKMILDAGVPAEDLESIRWIPTGAAPVAPEVKKAFEERYGCVILLSLGATEFYGTICAMTPDLHAEFGEAKVGSVGRALPGMALRVVDAETGAEVAPGVAGLLEVRADRVGPDWFRTSDQVVIDADGFMFHQGRADGAINRGGFKVLPEAIEDALRQHDGVSEAGVVAVPDDRLGQVPAAAIVARPGGAAPSPGELEAHLRDRVLATYVPVHWLFLDEMPRTASLKIDRGALQKLFAEERAAQATS